MPILMSNKEKSRLYGKLQYHQSMHLHQVDTYLLIDKISVTKTTVYRILDVLLFDDIGEAFFGNHVDNKFWGFQSMFSFAIARSKQSHYITT